ncbi:MAG: M28 family peptidase, partial [Candidatus Binatia bacterium]|nr:M28 family peptidase [Candidatus Binatia bacterium]
MKRRFSMGGINPVKVFAAVTSLFASLYLLFLATANESSDAASQPRERLFSNIRQLTFAGRRSGEGYFNVDGSMMIFQSERRPGNPFFQIYVMDFITGETRRVSPGRGKTTCGWIHPGGEKVLYASTHLDPDAAAKQKEEIEKRASGKKRRYAWDYDEHYDIFESDLHGRHLRNLTNTMGYDAEGSWSPDGRIIAFASNRHAYSEELSSKEREIFARDKSYLMDIYRMNGDGTDVRRLTFSKGYDGGPFFSADGKKLVWRRFSEDGSKAEVFTMDVDGTKQKQITRLGAMSWAPYFHPSGDYLIFATNLHGFGNIELYLVDSEGGSEPVRVTATKGFDGLAAFSPDGKQLSWTSNRTAGKSSQIFNADWDDAQARSLLGLNATGESSPGSAGKLPPSHPQLGQTVPEVSRGDLRLHISHLASDAMGGRLTGTEGERRATQYVASVFESLGLEPVGDKGTYFQEFEFTAGVSLGSDNRFIFRRDGNEKKQNAEIDEDWRPLAFSRTGLFKPASVVFAGYGIVSPEGDGHEAYDSYTHLEIKDKWVLVLRYLPEGIDEEFRQHLFPYASLRYKAMVVRDQGARGLIVVSGPKSKVKDELVRLSFDVSLAGTSIAAISITDGLAGRLLEASGKNLQDLQEGLDGGDPMMGFQIPGMTLEVSVDIKKEKRKGRNVLARLNAGKGPGKAQLVLGAHIDHLGQGMGIGSLARGNEKGLIHYGADDNASGVGGLLEIAQYMADLKNTGRLVMKRDVLFGAWSGEELGLLGSGHFVQTAAGGKKDPVKLSPVISAYLNMDMIGRLDKSLVLQGVGSSSIWPEVIERQNIRVGLSIVPQKDSYLPTDATSFYLNGVPVLSAFTGAHGQYHT